MRILFAASEIAPLAKTGGLADVAGALPLAYAALGHDVACIMPLYSIIDRRHLDLELVLPELVIDLPAGRRAMAVWRTQLARAKGAPPVTVYLLEDPGLYERPQLYAEGGREYADNPLRFGYYCMAALRLPLALGWMPDVIHCNDWQTALIPIYLARHEALQRDRALTHLRVLFSIHNLSYQGIYSNYLLYQLGLPAMAFNPYEMEFWGQLNLLKGALVHSHALSTVSRQYAKEIQTAEFGCGLDGVLHARSYDLTGILNGIDQRVWDPARDPHLIENYSASDLKPKAECKRFLQRCFGLPEDKPRGKHRPLIGMISRLANQKGLDLLIDVLPRVLAESDAQFVLLGTGQPEYHTFFHELAQQYPEKVGVHLGYDEALAHQIEAGADMFMMPSHFEPCGLNQMYSLRYGTVPIVRHTGGLADSIVHASPEALARKAATGFVFTSYTPLALLEATRQALRMYTSEPRTWAQLIKTGMAQDFSWERSAREYDRILRRLAPGR